MENSNTNASEKRIKSYEKKEQISKALPEIGIVIFGVLIMLHFLQTAHLCYPCWNHPSGFCLNVLCQTTQHHSKKPG